MSRTTTTTRRQSRNVQVAQMEQIEGRSMFSVAASPVSSYLSNFDNTRGGAVNVGDVSNRSVTRNNGVASTDTQDFYRFTVNRTTNVKVALSGLFADVDVSLQNVNGTVLASSTRSGTANESITRNLSRGTYFVRVYSYDRETSIYTLGLGNSRSVSNNPNPTPSPIPTPTPTPSPSQSVTMSGTLAANDGWQWREFTVNTTSTLRVTFNASYYADMLVVDSIADRNAFTNGNAAYGWASFDNQNGTRTITLSAGTYYMAVRNESVSANPFNASVQIV
jgi:Bacterial pre-peptidase C-terminal domain